MHLAIRTCAETVKNYQKEHKTERDTSILIITNYGEMRIHQQFDLKLDALKIENFKDIPRAINEVPLLVEKLIKDLLEKGYEVAQSSAYHMGIPQSITVVKDFTGPFATMFSAKITNDFDAVSKGLGIDRLFE